SGVFVTPEGLDFMRFRVVPRGKGGTPLKSVKLMIALDGETVYAGSGQQLANALASFEISIGLHRLEVFVTGWNNADAFDLLWESAAGKKAVPVPADWFDAKRHGEIREFVADRAEIVRGKDGFSAVFHKPVRLRSVRWEFLGRRGPDVAIESLSALDAEGRDILPVASDFSDAQRNNTLEVAPGDRISVVYHDEHTSRGAPRKVEKAISSSFNNASVDFLFESDDYTPGSQSRYHAAYRFVPGDSLVVAVRDADLDTTDEADVAEAVVKARSGGSVTLKLLEQSSNANAEGVHGGSFMGLLKTAPRGAGAAGVLEAADNDELTLEYLDRENTNPGVPVLRTAQISATRRTKPVVTLFRAVAERVVDESPQAKTRLESIRRRPGNEDVEVIYRNEIFADPIDPESTDTTNAVVMNIDAPLLVRVNDPSRARHSASFLTLEAVSSSEIELAEEEGMAPETVPVFMHLASPFKGVSLRTGAETARAARQAGSFNGMIRVVVGTAETAAAAAEDPECAVAAGEYRGILPVVGTDTVKLIVKDGEDVIAERTVSFAADAKIDLVDSSLAAERMAVHCGERFYVRVCDADRDTSDEPDHVEVAVRGAHSGKTRTLVLTETLPHSGVFSGVIRPVILAKNEAAQASATGGVAHVDAPAADDDRFPVRYGDKIEFKYVDVKPFSSPTAQTLCVTGTVHEGSDGALRVFSKRFTDVDQAVLVQFRLAECLFEQAKDFRRRKQHEKSSEAIARGRFILEEALKNYPNTAHASQGEFLLANLSQELAAESKEAGDEEQSRRLYTEALSRFSTMLAASPRGEYAPRAQYHKALCLEMLGDFKRAGEEYVKMTYLYPDSELVGDATVRLATHYYKNEKRYDVSARIYENFQKRFPNHSKASRALFMCGSCYVKEGDRIQTELEEQGSGALSPKAAKMYLKAMQAFETMAETYRTDKPEMRAQALYWAGDAAFRRRDAKNAYLFLKRTVLEYPETEWARRARGLLLQESDMFTDME
ncbi:MAG: outer membrane protein assembly factor BamD, partial [Kiritimatiellae bacterium]|nr:outer membrane protein assembly factor BamD [Kiritimatiellia bacterium]